MNIELKNLNLRLDEDKTTNKNSVKLQDLEYTLYSEGGNTYLHLSGRYIHDKVECVVDIPRICLNKMHLVKTEYLKERNLLSPLVEVDYTVSFDLEAKDKIFVESREIRKEMTKEQIEKELGYKINII